MKTPFQNAGDPVQWLEQQLSADPGREFLEVPNGVARFTYGQMHELSGKLAAALAIRGVTPGDRVAVQVDKSAENVAVYIACLRMGAVLVPLNTAYKPAELEHLLSDSQPKLFIARPQDSLTAAAVAQRAGVGCLETLGVAADGTLMELAKGKSPTDFSLFDGSPEELATIIYTSGTTGRSKGAMLTRNNLYQNAVALAHVWRFGGEDILLHALPLFHAHGILIAINTVLACGASMILLPKFDAGEVCSQLPRCTVMMGVPTFYTRLLQHPSFDRQCSRNIRLFISGSAPLSLETHREFEAKTGQFILERYGMTETLILTAAHAQGPRRRGSVGIALPGIELRLGDTVNGAPLENSEEVGVIQVRGIPVLGYWRDQEKTATEFTRDGYFSTGDLGRIDADGTVFIVGRAKDLIITGGYNVYPKEVESEINCVADVSESAVIGLPHPDFGEGVTAIVTAMPGEVLSETTILRVISERLAKYKVPKRVIIVDELPRNALGKVQKNLLRERYASLYSNTLPSRIEPSHSHLAKLDVADTIAVITMQRDERRNALSCDFMEQLTAAIDEAIRQRVRVVILRARPGAAVWSSGLDISEIPPSGVDPLEWEAPLRRFIRTLEEMSTPIIAMIEGSVWGGACEIVFACDITIATPESTLALTPTRLGVPYSIGGMLSLLNATNPKLAREMMFTAKPISATRFVESGLINHLAPAGDIERATLQIAQDITKNSPLAIAVSKEQLRILAGAHPLSPETFERIQSLRKTVYCSDDYREGIQAFNEKRAPKFKGE